ncbi:MAG: hypothetical protein LJE73_00430 [Proteobacteria bacterium]|nr:hypothetical protein [Pseudomonadota bacterium]
MSRVVYDVTGKPPDIIKGE